MTERSHGAPDPVGPSHSGDRPARSRADLANVSRADPAGIGRTDAVIEALADRRAAACESDPAVRLLRALIADVDEPVLRRVPTGEAAEPAEGSGAVQPSGQGDGPAAPASRRRGPRTIVALGVAGVVLASTGVAAAGGGVTEPAAPAPQAAEAGRGEPAERTRPERASRARTRQSPDIRPVGVPAPPVRQADERRDRDAEPRSTAEPDPLRDRLEDLRDELEGLLPPQTPRAEPRQPPAWPASPGGHRDDRGDRGERDGRGHRGDRESGDQTRRRLDDIRRRTERRLDRYR